MLEDADHKIWDQQGRCSSPEALPPTLTCVGGHQDSLAPPMSPPGPLRSSGLVGDSKDMVQSILISSSACWCTFVSTCAFSASPLTLELACHSLRFLGHQLKTTINQT